jgi:nucleoid-associated protein YgaU
VSCTGCARWKTRVVPGFIDGVRIFSSFSGRRLALYWAHATRSVGRVPGEDHPTLAKLISLASLKSTPVITTAAAIATAGAVGVGAWYVAYAPEPAAKPPEPPRAAAPENPPAVAAAPRSEPKPQAPAASQVPSFDVARIDPTGEAVIAGRAAPGATVELLRDGQVHDRTTADKAGEFVLIPKPLPQGAYDLSLRATEQGGAQTTSKDSVAVALGQSGNGRPLVALVSPDKPAEVLSSPPLAAAPPAAAPASPPQAAAPQAAPASPPQSAPAPQAAPSKPSSIAAVSPPDQPKPAATALKIAIDAVESESSGKLFVAGRAAPGATVRLYLNDSYIAQATASAEGKVAFSIGSGVRPGDYQVRLDEVESGGKVKSRAEVAFNAPVLSKPTVAEAPRKPADEKQVAAVTPPAAPPGPVAAAPTPAAPKPAASPAPVAAAPAAPKADTPSVAAAPTTPAPSAPAPTAAPAKQPSAQIAAAPPAAPAPSAPPPAAPSAPAASAAPPAAPSAATPQPPGAASSSDTRPALAAAEPSPSVVVVPKIDTTVVSRGDSLWRISRETYGRGARYSVIYQANQTQIRDPDLIYPGQIFVLPVQTQ